MKKTLFAILLCVALAMPAIAQQNILGNLSSVTAVGAATNGTAHAGSPFGWSIDQIAVLQFTIVGTNTTTGTLNITFDTSDDGSNWKLDQYNFRITATSTTAATDIQRLTNSIGARWLRFGNLENTNAASLTITAATLSKKQQ